MIKIKGTETYLYPVVTISYPGISPAPDVAPKLPEIKPAPKPIPLANKPAKPIGITTPDFIFDLKPTKETKKIEATIVDNKKELKQVLKDLNGGIVYDQAGRLVYSIQDGKKNVIAKNKTGEDLTQDNFGKNIKFIDSDKIINSVATNKNNSGSGVDINKLLDKFNKMERAVGKLKKSNKLLKASNKSLLETVDELKTSGGSSKNNSTNKDDITGLDTRLSSLEDFVKIDRKQLPSSDPNAGIGYFIHRNYTDIQSNASQFDDVHKRLYVVESNLAGNHINDYKDYNVIANLIGFTSRLDAVEAALAG